VSGLGWGTSAALILGFLVHRAAQPQPNTRVPSYAPDARTAGSPSGPLGSANPGLSLTLNINLAKDPPPAYLAPIGEFIQKTPEELCAKKAAANPQEARDEKAWAEASEACRWVTRWGPSFAAYRPHFLIVCLADPERSRSGYRFDLAIESIQRAASARDPGNPEATYVLDQYYLPWKSPGEERPYDSAAAKKFPGVALFRSLARHDPQNVGPGASGQSAQTLVVFLVGDTPTGGIHKRAFETALDIVSWFGTHPAPGSTPHASRVDIVGPAFSGSQHSLQTGLQTWWKQRRKLLGAVGPWQLSGIGNGIVSWFEKSPVRRLDGKPVVDLTPRWLRVGLRGCSALCKQLPTLKNMWTIEVIGTATALQPEQFRPAYRLSNGEPFLDPAPECVSLKTTCIPNQVLVHHLLSYVEKNTTPSGTIRVAHLRECNTGYGAETNAVDASPNMAHKHSKLEIIDVPFPMHISRVHARHEEAMRRDEANVPQFSAFDRGLKIPADEVEGAESIPQQDQVMTALYQDVALSAALQTLAKQQAHYILVSATDPRDKIFLASVVARHCPDTRLLITVGDQLFTHTDYVRYLAGAFVVSSYPLSPIATERNPGIAQGDFSRFFELTSHGENLMFSYYNAVAAHLNKPGILLFYDRRVADDWHQGESERAAPGPGVWISQIGPERADVISFEVPKFPDTHGLEHIWSPAASAIRSPDLPGSPVSDVPGPHTLLVPEPTIWWPIWLWGTVVVEAVVCFFAWGLGKEYLRPQRRLTMLPSTDRDKARRARLHHILIVAHVVAVFAVSAAVGYTGGVVFKPRSEPWISWIAAGVGCVLWLSLLGWDVYCWTYGHATWHEPKPRVSALRRLASFKLLHCLGLIVSSGAIAWWFWSLAPSGDERWLHAKVVHVGWNSPFVPLLLVLAVILCWCWLQGMRVRRVLDVEKQWDPIGVQYEGAVLPPPAKPAPKVPNEHEWMDHLWQSLKRQDERLLETFSQWFAWPLSRDELADEGWLRILWSETQHAWTTLRKGKVWESLKTAPIVLALSLAHSHRMHPNWYWIVSLAFAVFGFFAINPHWAEGPDGQVVRVIGIGIVICWFLIASEVGRIWEIWKRLETVHRGTARLPMQRAFANLPEYFVRSYGDMLFVERFRDSNSPALDQQLNWLLRERERLGMKLPFELSEMVRDKGRDPYERRGPGSWIRQYNRAARLGVFELWGDRQAKESYVYPAPATDPEREMSLDEPALPSASAPPKQMTAAEIAQSRDDAIKRQLRTAEEELLAMSFVVNYSQYRLQLKSLAIFLMGAPIALLFATASYSFMPQGMLMDFTALSALVCLIVLATIYSGLNRDEFLSRVNGTAPHWFALSSDSVTTFLVLILPLVLALASRLPGGEVVYGWITSLIRSIPSQS
jgi:hypothetical protein